MVRIKNLFYQVASLLLLSFLAPSCASECDSDEVQEIQDRCKSINEENGYNSENERGLDPSNYPGNVHYLADCDNGIPYTIAFVVDSLGPPLRDGDDTASYRTNYMCEKGKFGSLSYYYRSYVDGIQMDTHHSKGSIGDGSSIVDGTYVDWQPIRKRDLPEYIRKNMPRPN